MRFRPPFFPGLFPPFHGVSPSGLLSSLRPMRSVTDSAKRQTVPVEDLGRSVRKTQHSMPAEATMACVRCVSGGTGELMGANASPGARLLGRSERSGSGSS